MTRRALVAAGVLVASVVIGCATSTTSRPAATEQVILTKDGGRLLLLPGYAPQAAARDALAIMQANCGGEYEIIEAKEIDLTRPAPSAPSQPITTYYEGGYSEPRMALGPVYGTSVLYLCRKPENTGLNRAVAAFASQDFLGKICSSDRDCGFYVCTRSTEPPAATMCTAADGSIPIAREGEACDTKPCMAPLSCLKRGGATRCVNP
jgi:hypothetical protein